MEDWRAQLGYSRMSACHRRDFFFFRFVKIFYTFEEILTRSYGIVVVYFFYFLAAG